jgi:hypothetical protein
MLTRCRTLQPHSSVMVVAIRRCKRPRLDTCTSGTTCPRTLYWYSRAFELPEPPVSNRRSFQLGATAVRALSNLDSKIGVNSLTRKSTIIWYRLDFVDQHGRACETGTGNMDCSTVWSLPLETSDDFIVEDIKQAVKQAWRKRAMDTTSTDSDNASNVLAGISVAWIQVLATPPPPPPHSARKDSSKRAPSTAVAVAPRAGGGAAALSPLRRRPARETVPTARPLDPGAVWSPIHHGVSESTCPLILRVTLPTGKFACKTTVASVSTIIVGIANQQCHYLCRDDHSTNRTNCISVDRW